MLHLSLKNGESALMLASKNGHTEIVKYLVESKASLYGIIIRHYLFYIIHHSGFFFSIHLTFLITYDILYDTT